MTTIQIHPDYARHLQATRPGLVMVPVKLPADMQNGTWRLGVEYKPGHWGMTYEPNAKPPGYIGPAIVTLGCPFGPPGSEVRFEPEEPYRIYDARILTIARSELRPLSSITEEEARRMGFRENGYHLEPRVPETGVTAREYARHMLRTIAPDARWLWLGRRAEG